MHGDAELFRRRSFGDLAQGEVIRGELGELLGRQLLQGSVPARVDLRLDDLAEEADRPGRRRGRTGAAKDAAAGGGRRARCTEDTRARRNRLACRGRGKRRR